MAPCAMDFELELTQIHNWLDAFVTFRPLLEHVYSKASQQTKNIYWSMVICNNFVQVSKILCNKDGQTKWLLRPSRTTILDNISHLKSSRIASLCPPSPYVGIPKKEKNRMCLFCILGYSIIFSWKSSIFGWWVIFMWFFMSCLVIFWLGLGNPCHIATKSQNLWTVPRQI